MRRLVLSALFAYAALGAFAGSAAAQTFPYDHIHVNVPDPKAAADWYEKNFGGKRITEAPNRLMYGAVRFMFLVKKDAKPSAGSAIDHVGFSVADVDAKFKEFQTAGVKIVTPVRDVPGLFKLGFVEDPWGTRIEVVQDPELLGLHHLHLRGPNPDEMFAWLQDKFGGERTKLKGRLDAMKSSAASPNRAKDTPSITSAGDPWGRWRRPSTGCALKASRF